MKNLQPLRHGPRPITTRHYLIGLLVLVSLLVASPALAGKLHKAAEKGKIAKVERLIAKGADVNAKSEKGYTPLHLAASNGHTAVAGLLIAKGANVNSKSEKGSTSLHYAARKGHTAVAELLIAKGADINAPDKDGVPPLPWACKEGHVGVVELLIAKGADVNAKTVDSITPLYSAAFNGHKTVVQLLIASGANVNATSWKGERALDAAAKLGHTAVAELLIAKGADVNAKPKKGYTPLHRAAFRGHTAVVELLIAKGANVNAKNEQGYTPLQFAKQQGHEKIAKLLKQHGADQPVARKRVPAQATGEFKTYIGHQHQFLIDLPPGWFAYDQRGATTGKASPFGMVIFTPVNIAEMNVMDQGTTMARIVTGDLPSFFVDRAPKKKKMSCSYFGKKEVKEVVRMLKRHPSTGRTLKVTKALEAQPVTIGRCKGYRIRGEIQSPSGTIYINDVHVVSDGKILYLFALRNTRENYESNLGFYEKAISTVQLAALEAPFEWDAKYATPGTSLTVEEKTRTKSRRGTVIFYEVRASGFGKSATLWRKQWSSYTKSPVTVDKRGMVRIGGATADVLAIGGYVPGQAVEFALVAGDKRAHAKTIPFPIEAREANCSASVELVTESGFVFVITFSGFKPGEAVQTTSQYKKERNVITAPASARGEVGFPVLFGPSDRGTAIATAAADSCTVSVQYKVGRDAIVLQ